MYTCPCCGYATFASAPGSFEICPVCRWEDDPSQLYHPFCNTGANRRSLAEAQVAFVQFGAASASQYLRDPHWFPLWQQRADIPDEASYAFHNDALIGVGKSRGLAEQMLVVAGGVYKGTIHNVFPNRARVMFYGGLPAGINDVVVHPDKRWSKRDWLAEAKKGEQDAEKAGSTRHGKGERGGQ